jgi:multiple sugar transport system ATP-binding protein
MAEIAFQQVSKEYADGHRAVSDLDLHIRDGELLILVGPSGCGKSTALRMIAGLEDITAGQLTIDGRVVNGLAPKDRDVAMVFQSYALYPHMTVADNMGFSLRLRGMDRAEIDRRVALAAGTLDLTEHLQRRPAQLSGGQRQRVAMGRAIVREPAAFLMDEPLSNLDAKLRVEMRLAIAQLQARLETTTVYVTHDQTEAMTLGDRVAVLRGGVLQQVATPSELYAAPANRFVAEFIGSPAMGFLRGTCDGTAVRTPIGELPIPRGLTAGEVAVGIRPECFEDAALVDGDRPGHRFDADVLVVESVGSDVFAHLRVGAADDPLLVARVDADSRVAAATRHRFWLDQGALHVFEAETGRALLNPRGLVTRT